ncbi:double-stranded RNA-binding protein 4 isoform X4 [Eucalyptus grandis]|uniref:double-stranded RNA-binding protein 4 isoform X4 n=1 Tax=Eucalyptus grandis TaxID=71139 RepID=UPI00192EA293|nr:double-stranded RNA-binding protein 4 isoform X4 [Eucalyptus grandis]
MVVNFVSRNFLLLSLLGLRHHLHLRLPCKLRRLNLLCLCLSERTMVVNFVSRNFLLLSLLGLRHHLHLRLPCKLRRLNLLCLCLSKETILVNFISRNFLLLSLLRFLLHHHLGLPCKLRHLTLICKQTRYSVFCFGDDIGGWMQFKPAPSVHPPIAVPVRTDNLSQFRQTELLPLAIPTQALALPSSLAPASSQAPVQAQVFNPSLLVPARMDDLSDFSQPEPPTVVPAQALAPPSTQASERAQVSCPPSCAPEHVRYKNRLQEYTQKIMVHFPIYNTINEGSQHAPRYRSTVFVDGKSFTSPNTFPQKKEAEQNVAQIALELLSQKMEDEACPLIHEDTIFCKSILNEYAAKMNLEMPNYRTIQPQGAVPVFASSLVFNGVTYTGDVGKSKKEAEQLAARAAIQSLYDDSKSKIVLLKTIKSKWKLYAAYRETKYSCPVGVNVGGNSEISDTKNREGSSSGPPNYILGSAIPEACSELPKPHHLFQIPRAVAVASSAVENPLISFVPSSTEQQPIAATNPGKKRRKN